jgi:hypothetical protein
MKSSAMLCLSSRSTRTDLKDLCVYRDIKHRDRFVSNDEFRLHGKRSGNHDPLALPTRQFVREAGEEITGRIEPSCRERFADPLRKLFAILDQPQGAQWLRHDCVAV